MQTLQEQLQNKNAQIAAMREISQAIAEAQDLQSTLDLITQRTTEVMHVNSCSIYLYNDLGDTLVLASSTGLKSDSIGRATLPYGAGITGWAAEHRQVVAVSDAFSDDRFYRVVGSGESQFVSLMATPLVNRDKVIGAVNVQTSQPQQFNEDLIEIFRFTAELAGIAIQKAQSVHRALVQEMHHRVKNNLQTVAMLLRLQASYPQVSAKDILNETINRVLSIATVHDILSESGTDQLSILNLIKRLAQTLAQNMTNPQADIDITVSGDDVVMMTQPATSLALVANELIQNALEHGLSNEICGQVMVRLQQINQGLSLAVQDDGRGLPANFDAETDLGLGLEIARTTITEDLSGTFQIEPVVNGKGTQVNVWVPVHG